MGFLALDVIGVAAVTEQITQKVRPSCFPCSSRLFRVETGQPGASIGTPGEAQLGVSGAGDFCDYLIH